MQERSDLIRFAYAAIARTKPTRTEVSLPSLLLETQTKTETETETERALINPIKRKEMFMPLPNNHPAVGRDPEDVSPHQIPALPPTFLVELQNEADQAACFFGESVDDAPACRYRNCATEALRADGDRTGAVRIVDGGGAATDELPKKAGWDQDRLAAMVGRIRAAGDDPAQYVDTAFAAPERKYAAWPDAIRAGFEPAPTVRPGRLKFEIVPQGGDQ